MTNVQLLHGAGFELGPEQLDILTFEHASSWRLGSNFFFFDVTEPLADDTGIYGEWYSRLAWSSLGLRDEGKGLLRDVSFTGSLNVGEGFRAYLAGITVHLRVPGFALLDLDLMAYDDRSDAEVTYIVTPAWEIPFTLGSTGARFRGFVDIIGGEGDRERQLLAQPQLLVDIASLWGRKGNVFLGMEYQYWRNKYGVSGITESLPQVIILWEL